MSQVVDMHMHAGFSADPAAFARELANAGIAAFANTVTPIEYLKLASKIDFPDIRLGIGLHPWWVGTEQAGSVVDSLMLFEDGLEDTRFVGEVGLDFWPKHEHSKEEQVVTFKHIAMLCARKDGCLMSMHSVKAERELLDILNDSGCLAACTCILHSYAGPSDQLQRAIDAGCYFSIGERMLKSKKGREYARIIPESRLLAESDLPSLPGEDANVATIAHALDDVIRTLAEIRGLDCEQLREPITSRSLELLA